MFVDEINKENSSEKTEGTVRSDEKTNSNTDAVVEETLDDNDVSVDENAKHKEDKKENNRDKNKDKEKDPKKLSAELKAVKEELAAVKKAKQEAEAALAEFGDKYLRLAAEYDNYRRRSIKEREDAYRDAYGDALLKMLPMIDNFERAAQYTDTEPEKLADGVKLILKGLPDLYSSLGVEAYGEVGDVFDPTIHNAVMRSEDGTAEPGTITAVLQKGYRLGDKILRYAAVVVAGE
ncbi:MAG TPA: nucleotide exchange factor GrpE [Bacillota bacterium]|nr:nucleotide exchange factor GrpE [Bacillota bacterium]